MRWEFEGENGVYTAGVDVCWGMVEMAEMSHREGSHTMGVLLVCKKAIFSKKRGGGRPKSFVVL